MADITHCGTVSFQLKSNSEMGTVASLNTAPGASAACGAPKSIIGVIAVLFLRLSTCDLKDLILGGILCSILLLFSLWLFAARISS